MLNRYPVWKYVLMIVLTVWGVLYAVPSFYSQNPAVQISPVVGATHTAKITPELVTKVKTVLAKEKLTPLSISESQDELLVRFNEVSAQLKAREVIKATLGQAYTVALNLASTTPKWFSFIGAVPMKMGLDLRGGVHFLLAVDLNTVLKAREQGDLRGMGNTLRTQDIRYAGITFKAPHSLLIHFRDQTTLAKAKRALTADYQDYTFTKMGAGHQLRLVATLSPAALTKIREYTIGQTMSILRNRVNELGVSDAIVQQQGLDQISVDLPGIQDTARAKSLIGNTATLKFQLVDSTHDVESAVQGDVPFGSSLHYYQGQPILLKNQVILHGSSITYATSGIGQNGRPNVQVRLGGGGESLFARMTAENVGQSMGVVMVETTPVSRMVNGKVVTTQQIKQTVINVATIQSGLGNSFQITGLESTQYAQNLALLLRSGALTAPVQFLQETTVGPTLGKENIHKGVLSIEIGALIVFMFMIFYYRLFGLVANMALVLNIFFIVALLLPTCGPMKVVCKILACGSALPTTAPISVCDRPFLGAKRIMTLFAVPYCCTTASFNPACLNLARICSKLAACG